MKPVNNNQHIMAEEKIEELKLTNTFRQSDSFVMTSKNEKSNLNKLLF